MRTYFSKLQVKIKPVYLFLFSLGLAVIFGALLRLQRMMAEPVWLDESIYLMVARGSSVIDLLKSGHWVIDHPPGFFLLSRFWNIFDTTPLWIRLPNLGIYFVTAYFIYRLGSLFFKTIYFRFFLVTVYAIFPYFVGIEWQAVPYALALCLFISSLYFFLQIGDIKKSSNNVIYAAILMALFFYTSYESIYYFLSLILFNFILINRTSKAIVSRYIKMYSLLLLLSLPGIVVLINNFARFAMLATHLASWKWGVAQMFRDVFGIDQLLLAVIFVGLPLTYCLFMMMKKYTTPLYLVTVLIGGYFVSMTLVTSLFFYASHPKAYYYVIFLLWVLLLMILEWGVLKYGRKLVYVGVGLLFTTMFWFNPLSSWVKASYLYDSESPSPAIIRNRVVEIVADESDWILITDDELKTGSILASGYLRKYYFSCMDIPNSFECRKILEAKKPIEVVLANKNQKILGAITNPRLKQYFENIVCQNQVKCLVWDFEKQDFLELK